MRFPLKQNADVNLHVSSEREREKTLLVTVGFFSDEFSGQYEKWACLVQYWVLLSDFFKYHNFLLLKK